MFLISKKLILVPIIGCMPFWEASIANSNTPNMLLLSVKAMAGILFFFAKSMSLGIFRVLSANE